MSMKSQILRKIHPLQHDALFLTQQHSLPQTLQMYCSLHRLPSKGKNQGQIIISKGLLTRAQEI